MKKIYFITLLDLDNKYKYLSELEVLDDEDYKNYVEKYGQVFTFEEFVLATLRGDIQIPIDDNERSESISYRIF